MPDSNYLKAVRTRKSKMQPPNPPDDRSCYIPLSQGKFALVDKADFEWLKQWNWSAARTGLTFYATRSQLEGRKIAMHRFILDAPDGMEVDHIDSDGLDNRRDNLRLVTRTENLRSRRRFKNNKTGFKGIVFNSRNGRWKATINLGTYDSPEEAARAYDLAIRKLFGPLAKTNFDE